MRTPPMMPGAADRGSTAAYPPAARPRSSRSRSARRRARARRSPRSGQRSSVAAATRRRSSAARSPAGPLSSAISLCAAMSTVRGRPQRRRPTAYIERRIRRTISDRRSLRQLAVRVAPPQRLGERLGCPEHRVDLRAGFLVEPLERELPARRGAPVGHHPAPVAPGALEHLLEQDAVAAGVLAVDLVVAAS